MQNQEFLVMCLLWLAKTEYKKIYSIDTRWQTHTKKFHIISMSKRQGDKYITTEMWLDRTVTLIMREYIENRWKMLLERLPERMLLKGQFKKKKKTINQ